MPEAFLHTLFWSALTIGFYWLSKQVYRRWPRWWLMPLAVTPLLLLLVVVSLHESYRDYIGGTHWLVLLLGVAFPVFPLSGRIDPVHQADFATPFYLLESLLRLRFSTAADIAAHMVMPVLALGLPLAAIIARVLKGALMEAMVQDYILLARLKGMSSLRLVLQEALRNAIGPTIALTGVQFTFLIGGTVIVERIFAYPGIGNMAIDAVINRDLPLIQGLVLAFGALFILINLLVDMLVVAFNPRLRHG